MDVHVGTTLEGQADPQNKLLVANIPSRQVATNERSFRLKPVPAALRMKASGVFEFKETSDKSLGLWERQQPVLVYNHGVLSREGVPADRNRGTYVHPLYGLNGEVLSDDFPKDHYHHRGLFWAWPHVRIDGAEYDLWMLQGIQQRFERWLGRETGVAGAWLGVENGWYVGTNKVVAERVWFRVYSATPEERSMDLEFTWVPLDRPLTLWGAEGKSYGGVNLRFATNAETVITVPEGKTSQDLQMARLAWADLAGRFGGIPQPSGAAIFVHPSHPNYPPTWLTRHYGVLCVGWPGVEPMTFPPGQPIRCRYRVLVHGRALSLEGLRGAYQDFETAAKVRWQTAGD